MANGAGAFVISLDMELYWGMRDRRSLEAYGPNILGVRAAIPAMLDLFDRHGVKATFAAVGLLFFDTKEALTAGLPELRPGYADPRLSPYHGHIRSIGANEQEDPYHFGASLLRMIKARPAHEIACHTFSHYYCLERGQTGEEFRADLRAANAAARAMGITLRSFVFPRNQYNEQYLRICAEEGIMAFRGNENSWTLSARNREEETRSRRALRLLDTFVDLTGPHTHALPRKGSPAPIDLPSSRFLRPYSPRYAALDGLKLRRITKAMDHAARNGRLYHLWWHPHNFGVHLDRNIAFLDRVLDHFGTLREQEGLRSMTMAELSQEANG